MGGEQVPGADPDQALGLPPATPQDWPWRHAPLERRDAAENRHRILAVARQLFRVYGVDAVTMNQIAHAAGIGAGTLYRRFAHKGLLCAALLEDHVARFYEEVRSRRQDGSALEQLAFILAHLQRFNEQNAPLLGAMADAASGKRRWAAYEEPLYRWLYQEVVATLREATKRGEVPPLDAEWLADALLAPLAIDLYLYQRQVRGFTPERIRDAITRLLGHLGSWPGERA